MKTYTNQFKKLVSKLKSDITITDIDEADNTYIEILEPSCNLNFVNTVIGITTTGKIITQQYSYDKDSIMINEFSHIMYRDDKVKVCELVESYLN